MIITKGVIKKKNLDYNNHVNIAEYIKFADKANSKIFNKININKKFLFVAKKTFVENKSELFNNEKWKIKSFIIKLVNTHIVTRHEIYKMNQKKIISICNFLIIPLLKLDRKITKIPHTQIRVLKKNYKKDYFSPFQ